MQSIPNEPPGFCPKCGYPMTPGVCPECGVQVSAAGLARRSLPARRRRRRRVLALMVLVAVCVGGYSQRGWIRANWAKKMPTSVLMYFDLSPDRTARTELLKRDKAGKLTADQSDQLFRRLTQPPILKVRPAYPAGYPCRVEIQGPRSPGAEIVIHRRDLLVHLDGKPIEAVLEGSPRPLGTSGHFEYGRYDSWFDIPQVSVGRHKLAVFIKTTVYVDESYSGQVAFELNGELIAASQPITDFVRLAPVPEAQLENMTSGIRIDSGLGKTWIPARESAEYAGCGFWNVPQIVMPTKGWRDAPTQLFESRIDATQGQEPIGVVVSQSLDDSLWVNLNLTGCKSAPRTGRFDLVYRPSLTRAWLLGLKACPCIEARWSGVEYSVGGEDEPPVLRFPDPIVRPLDLLDGATSRPAESK